MNYLNPIFKINKYAYIVNLVLYLGMTPGMAFQIILGITQVITAIYATTSFYKELQAKNQKLLVYYWIAVSIDLGSFIFIDELWSTSAIILAFIIPMIIASLFLKLLSDIRKEINVP